jgi:hypothetical protein
MIRCGVCGCIQFASATVCPVCQARLEQRPVLQWVARSMTESPATGAASSGPEASVPNSAPSTPPAELGNQRTVAAAPARD